jgi:hypothetical protein
VYNTSVWIRLFPLTSTVGRYHVFRSMLLSSFKLDLFSAYPYKRALWNCNNMSTCFDSPWNHIFLVVTSRPSSSSVVTTKYFPGGNSRCQLWWLHALKAWVCGGSIAGVAGSNPARRHGCLSIVSVVKCQVEVSATG